MQVASERDLLDEVSRLRTRLDQVEQISQVGAWYLNLLSGAVELSQRTRRAAGVHDSANLTPDDLLDQICFADEAEHIRNVMAEAVDEQMGCVFVHRLKRSVTHDPEAATTWVRHVVDPVFDHAGELAGFAGVAMNISHEVDASTERTRFQETLERIQRDESSSYLAGGLAHEVANLLQAPLMACELMRMKIGKQDYAGLATNLEQIESAIRRTGEVVQATLDFTRAEPTLPTPIRVSDLVSDLNGFLDAALLSCLEIHVDDDAARSAFLGTRPGALQVTLNILKNAAEANPENCLIRLHGSLKPQAQTHQSALVLEFVDNGPGFSPEGLTRAFDPLFTTRFGSNGTGLGLSVTRMMIERWGGSVTVANEPAGGARLTVTLPVVAGEA